MKKYHSSTLRNAVNFTNFTIFHLFYIFTKICFYQMSFVTQSTQLTMAPKCVSRSESLESCFPPQIYWSRISRDETPEMYLPKAPRVILIKAFYESLSLKPQNYMYILFILGCHMLTKEFWGEFPGVPGVRTWHLHYRWPGFNPWLGN